MIHTLKKNVIFLLITAFCLGLAACGSTDDAAGDDWRATGMVVGSGTITHTGEGSVNVLVTVDENSAAFYRDEQEQILFDSVAFPMTIEDAEESFSGISFDDINGDGESDVCVSFVHPDGESTQMIWLWDAEERYVFREDMSAITATTSGGIGEYAGLWEYVGKDLWLNIYDDATWEFVDAQGESIECGTLWADIDGVTLFFDSSGDVLQLDRTANGGLIDNVNGDTLVPADSCPASIPYFTRNGLEINASVDAGTFLLENGVSSYLDDGEGYSTRDCYWEVIKNSDYTHDGIREIQFDAICYIPEGFNSYSDDQACVEVSGSLYDFYTGVQLTASDDYANSSRGENYYAHTIEWNWQSELIEFAYSVDWQDNVGDWSKVLTQSYVVYMPEDYDGLVFAAEQEPDNYWDCAMRLQLEYLYPGALIMDLSVADPYSSLFFGVCR